jgi:HEAT repeat protein
MDGLVSETNEERAVNIMVELLQDGKQSKDVQLSILTALGELGRKTQVPVTPLIEKLKHKDPQIRVRAIETLAKTKNKEASTVLVKMLNEETDKYPIIWALGEIRDEEAIPALNRFAASEDKLLSYNARLALAKIRTDETGVHTDPDKSDKKSLLEISRMVFKKYREVMMALFQKMAHMRRA